jgi:choline dehydrogenase
MSSSRAYLHPALKRKNLTVITKALATRVLFDGNAAIGVEYIKSGNIHKVYAKKEVILSAGSVNSPQLLQLSGIGPKSVLSNANVPLLVDNSAVGQNLQDHLGMDYFYKSKVPTLNNQLRPWWGKLWNGFRYVLTRSGPLSLSVNQAGGFVRTNKELSIPNIQLYFSPVSYTRAPEGKRAMMSPDPFPAFLIGVSNCRPKSRGQIRITCNDATAPPTIEPNYLSHEDDVLELLSGVKLIRKLAQAQSLSEVIIDEFRPGSECTTDKQLIEDIRDYAWTVFHPTSTCRMGPDPSINVVDSSLRVHGIKALRVVDASIFPNQICGNINAATMMIAEKASDLILRG